MKQFNSFGAFAAHLALLAGTELELRHDCLERAAVEIEARAKEKIGEYQGQAGPFEAWAPLAQSTQDSRESAGYTPDDPLLVTGAMRDSIEHNVQGEEAHIGSNDDKAVWQELGTETIPARSFLGGAAFELEPKIQREIGLAYVAHLAGVGRKIPIR